MLTESHKWILKYLTDKEWISPARIGLAYGEHMKVKNAFRTYNAGWALPKCKELVTMGRLERNEKGHFRYNKIEVFK